jgi:hypothetical protein
MDWMGVSAIEPSSSLSVEKAVTLDCFGVGAAEGSNEL